MFFCSELLEGVCQEWVPVGQTLLSIEDLTALSAAILGVLAVAYGFRLLRQLMLGR